MRGISAFFFSNKSGLAQQEFSLARRKQVKLTVGIFAANTTPVSGK
jgi:hypothetical protein